MPVIVLMTYEPTGGGHYRVAIGYNDTEKAIYFSDPWGRDEKHKTDKTEVIRWTYDEFQSAWNYSASGEGHPYFRMITLPWKVDVTANGKLNMGSTYYYQRQSNLSMPKSLQQLSIPGQELLGQYIIA